LRCGGRAIGAVGAAGAIVGITGTSLTGAIFATGVMVKTFPLLPLPACPFAEEATFAGEEIFPDEATFAEVAVFFTVLEPLVLTFAPTAR
jgi:hypothetical protein